MKILHAISLLLVTGLLSINAHAQCSKPTSSSPSFDSLMDACRCGYADAVKANLKAGVNPNAHDVEYWTPLKMALDNAQFEVADVLIANGADVDFKADRNESVIFGLARAGSVRGVKYLVSKGANVNARNSNGETPLFVLMYRDRVAVAGLLIDAGSDVNAKDKNGVSALSRYREMGDEKMVALLLARGAKK